MDSQELMDSAKRNIIPISLGTIGLLLLLIGVFQAFTQKSNEPEIVFEESKEREVAIELVVDVGGAVMNPGVYKLASISRMVDALAAAGGLSEDADREFVEKNINLAGKISDGIKIYIPRAGEEILAEDSESGSAGPVLNINVASSQDLETLPGIGEVTAQKIIEGRPYASTDELLNKKIIGSSTYEKIKDKIAAN